MIVIVFVFVLIGSVGDLGFGCGGCLGFALSACVCVCLSLSVYMCTGGRIERGGG